MSTISKMTSFKSTKRPKQGRIGKKQKQLSSVGLPSQTPAWKHTLKPLSALPLSLPSIRSLPASASPSSRALFASLLLQSVAPLTSKACNPHPPVNHLAPVIPSPQWRNPVVALSKLPLPVVPPPQEDGSDIICSISWRASNSEHFPPLPPTMPTIMVTLAQNFIPDEILATVHTVEPLFIYVEEAWWYYKDIYCKVYPQLPKMNLERFAQNLFLNSPQLSFIGKSISNFSEVVANFKNWKASVPCAGAIVLDPTLSYVMMVRGFGNMGWGFPKGKLKENESPHLGAIREVREEIGLDVTDFIRESEFLELESGTRRDQLYICAYVSMSNRFCPVTRNEIREIAWHKLDKLSRESQGLAQYRMVAPCIKEIVNWVEKERSRVYKLEMVSAARRSILIELDQQLAAALQQCPPSQTRPDNSSYTTQIPFPHDAQPPHFYANSEPNQSFVTPMEQQQRQQLQQLYILPQDSQHPPVPTFVQFINPNSLPVLEPSGTNFTQQQQQQPDHLEQQFSDQQPEQQFPPDPRQQEQFNPRLQQPESSNFPQQQSQSYPEFFAQQEASLPQQQEFLPPPLNQNSMQPPTYSSIPSPMYPQHQQRGSTYFDLYPEVSNVAFGYNNTTVPHQPFY
ncbi:mutT/nudix family protein [Pelomyxa schiedti]|nr:mutT/nudix family protein [Pelomyxa schiedti]